VPSSKPLARAYELLQKLANRSENSLIIWNTGIEQDLRAVAAELDNAARSIQDPETSANTTCVLPTLNVLLRYDDHWGALFKKAESGQEELITKIQLWMYGFLKGIPEQSPTWEVAELREGTKVLRPGICYGAIVAVRRVSRRRRETPSSQIMLLHRPVVPKPQQRHVQSLIEPEGTLLLMPGYQPRRTTLRANDLLRELVDEV
jgi:hypothetical protein